MINKKDSSINEVQVIDYKRILTIDKLILTAEIKLRKINNIEIGNNVKIEKMPYVDSFTLQKKHGNAKMFFKLLYKNKFVATILFHSISYSVVIFENITFYTNFNEYFIALITNEITPFKNIKLRQLEIAMDINENSLLTQIFNFKTKERVNKEHLKYKTDIIEYPNGYYVGRNKYICIYDKKKQLNNVEKPYIEDYYLKNGFDLKKGITRIELRISRNHYPKMYEIEISKIVDGNYLNSYISEILQKKLIVVNSKNNKLKRNLLNVDFSKFIPFPKYSNKEKGKKLNTIKKYITRLYLDLLKSKIDGQINEGIYLALEYHVKKHNLEDWLLERAYVKFKGKYIEHLNLFY